MQHQLYPLLEVEYDDLHRAHFLTDTDAEAPHRRWLHSHCVAYKFEKTEASEGSLHSWDLVGYVELMSNEYCHPKLTDLVGYVDLMSNLC